MKIPLNNNQWAIVDDDDADDILAYNWFASLEGRCSKKLYVVGYHRADKSRKRVRLHRIIMNLGKGDERNVHHIDNNTLDCRKHNLMIMSHSEHSKLKRKTWQNKKI